MMNRDTYKLIVLSALLLFCVSLFAQTTPEPPSDDEISNDLEADDFLCPNSKIIGKALIKDVCWEGIFPIYLGDFKTKGPSELKPVGASNDYTCACGGDLEKGIMPSVGSRLGLFLPKYLLTVTRRPYCFPELNGTSLASQLGLVSRMNIGNEDWSQRDGDDANNQSSWTWHLAALPLLKILEVFDVKSCFNDGYVSYDMLWISETLPTWYDAELAYYVAPESMLFTNPLALASIVTDCVASTVSQPLNALFFAAGCWGNMYPLTAHAGSNPDKVAAKSLIASRALFFLSRIGMLERTMGDDAICKPRKMPILKKTQYRMQQLWPMSESASADVLCHDDTGCDATTQDTTLGPEQFGENLNTNNIKQIEMNSLNETCTHPIGQSTFRWGVWRGAEQDSHASYLIFQWEDCCIDLVGPGPGL